MKFFFPVALLSMLRFKPLTLGLSSSWFCLKSSLPYLLYHLKQQLLPFRMPQRQAKNSGLSTCYVCTNRFVFFMNFQGLQAFVYCCIFFFAKLVQPFFKYLDLVTCTFPFTLPFIKLLSTFLNSKGQEQFSFPFGILQ